MPLNDYKHTHILQNKYIHIKDRYLFPTACPIPASSARARSTIIGEGVQISDARCVCSKQASMSFSSNSLTIRNPCTQVPMYRCRRLCCHICGVLCVHCVFSTIRCWVLQTTTGVWVWRWLRIRQTDSHYSSNSNGATATATKAISRSLLSCKTLVRRNLCASNIYGESSAPQCLFLVCFSNGVRLADDQTVGCGSVETIFAKSTYERSRRCCLGGGVWGWNCHQGLTNPPASHATFQPFN